MYLGTSLILSLPKEFMIGCFRYLFKFLHILSYGLLSMSKRVKKYGATALIVSRNAQAVLDISAGPL